MRVDAHQHFWVYEKDEYGWIDEENAVIRKDHLPKDLFPLLRESGIDGCISVQARQSLQETEWLLELANENSMIKGVVGWVDLCSEHVETQLRTLSSHPLLKGIRHVLQDEPDPRFMLRDDFRRGISALGHFGLTYDLLLFPTHLETAAEFVQTFPEQPFVLDHIAKPDIANGRMEPWRDGLNRLAQHPNVYCKLSGMVTEAKPTKWQEADFEPYLDVVVDAFGADRLMIGSDWPVCSVRGSYTDVMNIVIHYIRRLPETAQAQILGGTCAQFYNISGA